MSVSTSVSAPPVAPSAASSTTAQQAQLTRLLQTYQNDVNDGQTTTALKPLAKQITDLARQLDENVTLPTSATASSAASGAAPTASVTQNHAAKLDVTA